MKKQEGKRLKIKGISTILLSMSMLLMFGACGNGTDAGTNNGSIANENSELETNLDTINEQISNFAQTYPTNLKASSNEALLFMRRYRFANCSCFSCCFKDAYPSSNVQ